MNRQYGTAIEPHAQAVLNDLEGMIRCRLPKASFAFTHEEDAEGTYLKVTVDLDDVEEIVDQELQHRLFGIQVEQGVRIFIIPLQPRSRVLAEIARHSYEPTSSLVATESSLASEGTGANH